MDCHLDKEYPHDLDRFQFEKNRNKIPFCRFMELVDRVSRENSSKNLLGRKYKLSEQGICLTFQEVQEKIVPVISVPGTHGNSFHAGDEIRLPFAVLSLGEFVRKAERFFEEEPGGVFFGSRFKEFFLKDYYIGNFQNPTTHSLASKTTLSLFKPSDNFPSNSEIVSAGECVFKNLHVSENLRRTKVYSMRSFGAEEIAFVFNNGRDTFEAVLPSSYCRSLTINDMAIRLESAYRISESRFFISASVQNIMENLAKVETVIGYFPSKTFPSVLAPFERQRNSPMCHIEKKDGKNILYIQRDSRSIESIGPITDDKERDKERERFLGRVLLGKEWTGRPGSDRSSIGER